MGFIEDLRRRKAEEEAWRLAEAKRSKRESDEESRRQKQERKRIEQEFETAKAHFQASDFSRLLKELSSVVTTLGAWSPDCDHSYNDLPVRYTFKFCWTLGETPPYGSYRAYEYNEIEITTDSEGTIQVKGRVVTTLPLNKWRGRADVQESALEQAYCNPKKCRYSPPGIESAGGYGMS